MRCASSWMGRVRPLGRPTHTARGADTRTCAADTRSTTTARRVNLQACYVGALGATPANAGTASAVASRTQGGQLLHPPGRGESGLHDWASPFPT